MGSVLLVGGSELQSDSLRDMLERRGHTVEQAPDCAQALNMICLRRFGLILLDLSSEDKPNFCLYAAIVGMTVVGLALPHDQEMAELQVEIRSIKAFVLKTHDIEAMMNSITSYIPLA